MEIKKQELERQRLERLRIIKESTTKYNSVLDQVSKFIAFMDVSTENNIQPFSEIDELSIASKTLQNMVKKISGEAKQLLNQPLPAEANDIDALTESINIALESLKNDFDKESSQFAERISIYITGMTELEEGNELSVKLAELKKQEKIDFSNFSFTQVSSEDVLNKNHIMECVMLINDESTDKKDKKLLMNYVKDMQDYLDKGNEKNVAAQRLLSTYTTIKSKVQRNIQFYNQLYCDYLALSLELEGYTDVSIHKKEDFDSIETLAEEIKRLELIARKENEHRYIREQIERVMKKYNYNHLDPIELQGSKKGTHYLSEPSSNVDALPVHFFVSEDNKTIMFEPIGLGNISDDEPGDFNAQVLNPADVSHEEKAWIVQRQEKFCEFYPKLLEELEKVGITFTNKKVFEASLDTARVMKVKGKHSTYKKSTNDTRARVNETTQKQRSLN